MTGYGNVEGVRPCRTVLSAAEFAAGRTLTSLACLINNGLTLTGLLHSFSRRWLTFLLAATALRQCKFDWILAGEVQFEFGFKLQFGSIRKYIRLHKPRCPSVESRHMRSTRCGRAYEAVDYVVDLPSHELRRFCFHGGCWLNSRAPQGDRCPLCAVWRD